MLALVQLILNKFKEFFKEWMPLIVSIAALYVSYNSYKISENQLSVSRVSVEPHFYVDEIPLIDEKTGSVYERELKVFNIGSPVANIKTTVRTFYEVDDFGQIGKKLIPLNGYYYASFPTGEPEGLIATHKGYENATKDFDATFIHFRGNYPNYLQVELKNIVYISYMSFEGLNKQVCFLNSMQIDCELVSSYKSLFNQSHLELEGLTYRKLVEVYERLGG
ncbi:TPA: hypothetical protein ACGUON_000774 [Vibrio vulnificus]